jgi:polysaccharide biosynthesis/export protein ExoF
MWKKPFVATVSVIALLWLGWISSLPAIAADDPYHLGIADKIRVKAFEWRSTVGEVHEWTSLNGDFSVGPGGTILMPMIGAVPAAGRTLEELANFISDRLQATVKMEQKPEISVEILEYRPFYILGAVNKPGEYPYRPGLTVLQALTIAGGVYRLDDPALRKTELTTLGDLRVFLVEHYTLLARRARLQAELNGRDTIEFPAELYQNKDDVEIAQIISREQATFAARREAFQSVSAALNRQKELYKQEILSLQAKIANAQEELTMLNHELESVTSLVGRGLAVAPREFALRQNQVEMQARRLDLDTAVLQAKEQIEKTEQGLIELSNQYHKELFTELAQSDDRYSEVSTRLKVVKAIIQQDAMAAPALATGRTAADNPMKYTIVDALTYSIVRQNSDGDLHEIDATETTAVMPGDTIKVRSMRPLPGLGANLSSG